MTPRTYWTLLAGMCACLAMITIGCSEDSPTATGGGAQPFSWEPAGGPASGIVYDAVVGPDGSWFAVTPTGGVYRMPPSSDSWEAWNEGLPKLITGRCIAIDGDSRLFIGTHGSGVFRGSLPGTQWPEFSDGLSDVHIRYLHVATDGNLYAGTYSGVFVSDGDAAWELRDNGLAELDPHAMDSSEDGWLYVGTRFGGMFRSHDSGSNWEAINVGLTNLTVYGVAVGIGGTVLAGTYGDGIFRSTDHGASWEPSNSGLTRHSIRSLTVDSGGVLFTGTYHGGIFRSSDSGVTWERIAQELPVSEDPVIRRGPTGDLLMATSYGAYRSSDDGESWLALGTGLTNVNVNDLLSTTGGSVLAATYGGAGIYASADGGLTWQESGGPRCLSLAEGPGGLLYAGCDGAIVHISDDGGETWEEVSGGITSAINALEVSPFGDVFAATYAGIFRLMRGQAEWEQVQSGGYTSAIACNSCGHLVATGGVYGFLRRSIDNGATWEGIQEPEAGTVYCLTDGTDNQFLAGTSEGVFVSVDSGGTWQDLSGELSGTAIHFLVADDSGQMFALSEAGLYRGWVDSGSWDLLDASLGHSRVNCLAVGPDGHLLAGTWGLGVMRSTQIAMSAR